MNRIISLSIEDMYIKYTGEAFGATGSHNAVTLRMTFGSAWEGTAKTAYFTDALGSASVSLVLGLDTLTEDGAYEVDVPSEALKIAGLATMTVKGVLVSGETTTRAITTAAGHFRVLDSELPDSAGNAGTITASDKEQLQAEIAGMETLFTTARAAAETAAANAKTSEDNAKASETAAAASATSAASAQTGAAESAGTASDKADAAAQSAEDAEGARDSALGYSNDAQTAATAAKSAQAAAETAKTDVESIASQAQDSAAIAAESAQTAQNAASTATGAASTANTAASAASGFVSQAQASAEAAAESAASVDGINKTAQSWAVGGTGTREGEDTDNAKYWCESAAAAAGGGVMSFNGRGGAVSPQSGDYTAEMVGADASGTAAAAVSAHNTDTSAHEDIRTALAGKETAGTAASVQRNLTNHAGNTTVHVTSAERTAWNAKAAGTHASQHGASGSDPITPDAIGAIASTARGTAGGVASLDTDGKVPTSQLPEISSVKAYTATIGTTWTENEDTGAKTQTVAIPGVLASHTAKVDHAYTGTTTSPDYEGFVEAENQYLTCITNGYAETVADGIKFTIFGDANTVSIPIVVEVA